MKDCNFMIPDDRLHKTRFCKKGWWLTFLIKRGVGAKGGGLEQFCILRGGGQKEGVTFLGDGGHTLVPTMTMLNVIFSRLLSAFCFIIVSKSFFTHSSATASAVISGFLVVKSCL